MAQQNSWSLMDPKKLAALGANALASGRVSPEEAAQNMGLAIGVDPSQANNPLAMSAPPQAKGQIDLSDPAGRAAQMVQEVPTDAMGKPVRGVRAEQSLQSQDQFKRSTNRLLTKAPDQYRAERLMAQGLYPKILDYNQAVDNSGNPIFVDASGNRVTPNTPGAVPLKDKDSPQYDFNEQTVDQNDPVQQQMQGLDRMQELLAMDAQAGLKKNMIDFRPLGALADARNAEMGKHTNIAGSMSAPEDPTQKFMAYADEIQKRRGDIQKAIAENARNMRGGTTMDQLAQLLASKELAGVDTAKGTAMDPQRRLDDTRYRQAINIIESKPQYQKALANLFTTNLELQLASSRNGPVSKEQVEELQNIVRRLPGSMVVASGGGTTGEERQTMTMKDVAKDIGKFVGYFNSGVNTIPVNDPQTLHFRALAQGIGSAYKDFYQKNLNSLTPGLKDVLERNPDLASSWGDYISAKVALGDSAGTAAGPAIRSGNRAKTTGAPVKTSGASSTAVSGFNPDAFLGRK